MSEKNVIMIDNEKVNVNDLNQDQQYYYQNALTKSYEDTNKKNKEEQNTETKILEK